jgi:hypothetical protein
MTTIDYTSCSPRRSPPDFSPRVTAMFRRVLPPLVALLAFGDAARGTAAEQQISFTRDVMAVLSKAGCNLGTCHGNANGKAGFKLSLRGQDPELDYLALTRDQFGRRVDTTDPAASLILLKATMQRAHEGGRRFGVDAWEYQTLVRWIAEGARNDLGRVSPLVELAVVPDEAFVSEPGESIQITALARFADGTFRDVSKTAVYETSNKLVEVTAAGLAKRVAFGESTVLVRYLDRQMPVRLAFVRGQPPGVIDVLSKLQDEVDPRGANYIDGYIDQKLGRLRIQAARPADDTTFLRRAYYDLCGLVPTADEAREFTKSEKWNKRAELIERLLDRPEFADYWALKFADLLRVEEKTLDRKGVQNLHSWIRRTIEQDRPLNQMMAELVAGRGSTYVSPAANYYRAQRDPVMRAETTAQVMLGVRLQCAKCHNHPFDAWTQTDYYRWTNLFAQVDYKVFDLERKDKNDKHEFNGEQFVWFDRGKEYDDPRTGEPRPPRVLGGTADLPRKVDRLEGVAAWLTDDANPYFARAQANRVWFHLFGRGLVDPIDDFRATNPATHPKLLEALAAHFARNDFRLKPLLRTIMQSKAYQRSSETDSNNSDDEVNYSHALPRTIAAEPLLDALVQVTETPVKFNGYPGGMKAVQMPGVRAVRPRDEPLTSADAFLEKFGKPPRLLTCECERAADVTLGQAFQLISGPLVDRMLTSEGNRIARLAASSEPPEQLLDELFWSTLSRAPNFDEIRELAEYVKRAADRRKAWEDVVWGLVNSKEFLLRR